jgi:purine-nucleoside phosphorylase
MLLKDHLSLPVMTLQHPLVGPNDERFGPRFMAANNIYDKKLRDIFKSCAKELDIDLREGVYATIGSY